MPYIKQHDVTMCPICVDMELVSRTSTEGEQPDGSGPRFVYGECLNCGWDTTDPTPTQI